jgi:ABC-type glycerol-3-phosphate transport system permease component
MKQTVKKNQIFKHAFLAIITVITIIPIAYTISASFKSNVEILLGGAHLIPKEFTWKNYLQAWELVHFDVYTLNSLRLSVITVSGVLLITSLAAYVFNRGAFPGKKFIYLLFLSTMFVSAGSIMLFPILKIATKLSLNNLTGVSIIQIFTSGATNLFLTVGYLKTIDCEIDAAATIDGCSFFRIYWNIILPLCRPILASVALISFRFAWNDYLLPLVMTMGKPNTYPLVVGIVQLKSAGGEAASQYNLMMAGTMFSILPIIIIYISMNRYFVSGMTAGAIKG